MAKKPATAASTAEMREDAEIPRTIAIAIKNMVAHGKERGYLTFDELTTALPKDLVSDEQIEDVMTMLSELRIAVIENASPTARDNARAKRQMHDYTVLEEAKSFAWAAGLLLRRADQLLAETRRGRKATAELLDRLEARLASHG